MILPRLVCPRCRHAWVPRVDHLTRCTRCGALVERGSTATRGSRPAYPASHNPYLPHESYPDCAAICAEGLAGGAIRRAGLTAVAKALNKELAEGAARKERP